MDPQGTIAVGRALPSSSAERTNDLEFLLEHITRSDAGERGRALSICQELLDNYMVVPFGQSGNDGRGIGTPGQFGPYPQKYRGEPILKDPESHQITESLSAQAMLLIFGAKEYLRASPKGVDDPEKARILSRVLMSVLNRRGTYRTFYQAWKDAFIFGTAVLEFSWESRSRQEVVPMPYVDEQGQPQVAYVPQMTRYKEGPLISQIDIFDFYPDPGGTRIQHDMRFVAKRFRITRQEAEALAASGVYDAQAVKEAFEGTAGSTGAPVAGGRERFPDKAVPKASKTGHFYGFEGWGFVPGKHADGSSNRVLTAINGKLVRSTINPHFRGRIPMKEIVVNPIAGRFYGLSPNEVNRFLQDSSDHMLMTMAMAANDMVRPRTLINQNANINPDELMYGKRWIMANGIGGTLDNIAKPLTQDYNALQFAQQALEQRKLSMRGSAGSLEPLGETLGGDRMAATTTSEIVRLASQRGELMATLSEREDFPEIGSLTHGLLRQFASDEGVIATFHGEPLRVPFKDINEDADIEFVGSRHMQSKFQRVAAKKEAIATMMQAMALIPHMPELFIEYLRDDLEINNGEQIVMQAVASIQAQMQAQASAKMPGAGSSPAGPAESSFGTETGQTEREGRRVA